MQAATDGREAPTLLTRIALPWRRARGLGKPVLDLHARGELLALTYGLGGIAVVVAWLVDPALVGNRVALGVLVGFVFVAALAMHVLRDRLPSWTGDAAIVGSLVLIDLGMFFTKLHIYPMLLSPFYVWVGFASPLWFSRRRSALYGVLAVAASGVVVAVSDTTAAVAGWVITMATMVVAFCITDFLTDALVKRERLAVVGEMASVVGHDLRNPLGAVSNAMFLLRHSLGDAATDDQQRHFTMAEREVAKASGIIDHLGAFVRPVKPNLGPVELASLVDEVMEVAPPPDRIGLSTSISPVTATADRGLLAEVLTNLVTNSYDAMHGGGTLAISAFAQGGSAHLVVEDNGPGIDRALEERVFEPFFTTKQRGTGLGLSIVRKLIGALNGSVHVERPSNGGTRFTIQLPLAPSQFDRPVDRPAETETSSSPRYQGTLRQYTKQSSPSTAAGMEPTTTQPSSS